jgi:ATP-dependent DNA helicase RecG
VTPAPDLFSREPEGAAATPTPAPKPPTAAAVAALSAPLAALPGIEPAWPSACGTRWAASGCSTCCSTCRKRYASRLHVSSPADAPEEQEVALRALVVSLRAARSKSGRPYAEVRAEAAGVRLLLRYINGRVEWLTRQMPPGTERVFAGKVKSEAGAFSMLNPLSAPAAVGLPLLEPVWPLVKDLRLSQVAKAMAAALERLPDFPEWQDPHLLRREEWPGFAEALRTLQAPQEPPPPGAHARLAYDEVLAKQIALALVRRRARGRPGRSLLGDDRLRSRALAAFGHPLTRGQDQALAEIDADLAAPHRALRLLQGDVGSGKTLVAALAMLRAVEAGAQAALMAPTEVLARQHLRTLTRLCHPAGVRVEFLAGSVKGAQRRRVLAGLAEGSIKVAVGTHALFQEGVRFRDLGPRRGGRAAPLRRGAAPHAGRQGGVGRRGESRGPQAADMLVMTATPIPRTLLLTHGARWR